MGSSEFFLKWNDHSNLFSSVCKNLLEDNFLVDCTIAAEGQFFKAHRLILSACSPYFKRLFKQDIEKHPIIFLRDTKSVELKALIDFIYQGEALVPEDCLTAFLGLAQSLKIKGLKEATQDNVNKPTVKISSRNSNGIVSSECFPVKSTASMNSRFESKVSHSVNRKNKHAVKNIQPNNCSENTIQWQSSYSPVVHPGFVNCTVEPEDNHSIYVKNKHTIENVQPNNCSENTVQWQPSYSSDDHPGSVNTTVESEMCLSVYHKNKHTIENVQPNNCSENTVQRQPSEVCTGLVNPNHLPLPVEVFNDTHYELELPTSLTLQEPCSSGVEMLPQAETVIKSEVEEIDIVETKFEEVNIVMDVETSDNCFVSKIQEIHRQEDPKYLKKSVINQPLAVNNVKKTKSHCLVVLLEGKSGKRTPRNRCKLCYAMISKQIGSMVAKNRTPKVSTYCEGCEGKPFLCKACFDEYHRIHDIDLHSS